LKCARVLIILLGLILMLGVVPVFGDYPYLSLYGHVYEEEYEEEPLYVSASVLIMDAETGLVLYENNGFARRYPASITKVMTALLVLEHVEDLTQTLTFSANAVAIPDYASRMWMAEGESITVLEGLYGNMLPSGNEVARALAEFVSGNVPDFVDLMNRRAEELGAYNTRFVNPCGLPGDGQFVTAYDVALIMREAIRHPLFVEIISTPYFDIAPTQFNEEAREIRNTNRMIRPAMPEFNEYVIGGKTGFTNAAQHTLVTYARRGEFTFIITTLYAPHWRYTYADTAALIGLAYDIIKEIASDEAYYEYTEPDAGEQDAGEPNDQPESVGGPIEGPPADDGNETGTDTPASVGGISDIEAIAVASMSLGVVIVAISFIWWFKKYI